MLHTQENGCTIGMDASTPEGYWCEMHNVNVTEAGEEVKPLEDIARAFLDAYHEEAVFDSLEDWGEHSKPRARALAGAAAVKAFLEQQRTQETGPVITPLAADLSTVIWSMGGYLKNREVQEGEGVSTHKRFTQPEADLIADWLVEIQNARDAYDKQVRDLTRANEGLVEQIEQHKVKVRETVREILTATEEILVQDIRIGDHVELSKFHASEIPTRLSGLVDYVVHDEDPEISRIKMRGIPEFVSMPKHNVVSRYIK